MLEPADCEAHDFLHGKAAMAEVGTSSASMSETAEVGRTKQHEIPDFR